MPATATDQGQRFGSLVVIGSAPSVRQSNGKMKSAVLARCDCGTEKPILTSNLRSGNSKSCGCQKYKGMAAFNAERATPQQWAIDGDIAHIYIGGVKVLIDTADVPIVGDYRWHLQGGYVVTRGGRLAMHRLILGLETGDHREGDHRCHNTADNRRSQIRIATSSQNKMNRRAVLGRRTSRFKGVHFDRARGLWAAQIKANGRQRLLGRFHKEEMAAAAYADAARLHFGEYACAETSESINGGARHARHCG